MSEKRKSALVTYLALLFGIAFVVVSISLVVQLNQGNDPNNTSAAANVAALQEQVQTLTAENRMLMEQVDVLQATINDLQENSEHLEGSAHDANVGADQLASQLQAYSLLATAQNAFIAEDAETLRAACKSLGELYHLLSSEHQDQYFLLLEYVEQPYFGTGTVIP